jgi:PAS domain S-box-containing protein
VSRCAGAKQRPGQILSWVGTFTDIDAQKRIQAIQAEFKGTLDAEPDAVVIFEPTNWRILYVNHGASVLLGYSSDELLRMAPADFMAEHDSIGFREVLTPLLDGSQPHLLLETKFRRRHPTAVPIDVSVQLIRIGPDRIVWIARDITERKRTQLERELLYREAVDAIRARDEFLSVASHELRTPLSALQLQIQTLLQPPRRSPQAVLSSERIKAKLEMAYRQTERLTRLVGQLMDVSRITAGRLRLELEEIDLSALVRDVVGRLGDEALRTRSDVQITAATPVVGSWDRIRVEQVVGNLLTNAFKFGGGKPIEITVEERGPVDAWSWSITASASLLRTWRGSSSVTSKPSHRAHSADWASACTSLVRSSRPTAGQFGSKASPEPDRSSPLIFRGAPPRAQNEPHEGEDLAASMTPERIGLLVATALQGCSGVPAYWPPAARRGAGASVQSRATPCREWSGETKGPWRSSS